MPGAAKRVLVTGHDGYIGPVMVRVLREAGHVVTGLDTLYFRGYTFGPDGPAIPALVKDTRDISAATMAGE